MVVRRLVALVVLPAVLLGLLGPLGPLAAPPSYAAARGGTYSAPLAQAIADLPVGAEVRTGYVRSEFKHWTDADGDGCSTRNEVLIAEADDPVTRGPSCSLSGGRWYSYYDDTSQSPASALDIDHMVPLAEAWDSGARSWSDATREAFANDLGDSRSLIAVTAALNRSKGDQDVAEWVPPHSRCRYLREFVAVKLRWRLSVDSAEKAAMTSLAGGCPAATITVTRAR